VTGRSVGIGAYLVRLGQRIIQKADSPILLTGYVALNNLLGKSVYLSNQQIGGSEQIMMRNGVSHYEVADDLEGAQQILKWLSYIPSKIDQSQLFPFETNIKCLSDPIDRAITYYPESDKYDPRYLIAGYLDKKPMINLSEELKEAETTTNNINETMNEWQSGLFDKDSFTEYLSSWARSVVVGRGRLGGIPVGIIATETRTTQCVIPPDPALEDQSTEISFSQPGSVWYPDSSYKTSQTIQDFKNEQLPLFILANWRGFSGGQRDMFHSILKYGAFIVDQLQSYKQPVFVYLPPFAHLRGGAWVVLDSLLNQQKNIEMYADHKAKANVLEPTAMIGLKYRKQKLLQTMHRIDPILIELDRKNQGNQKDIKIKKEIENRERGLFPIYNKIALMYAQLHDTPQRMKDVGVIQQVVPWNNARKYFYWRLRRKLQINQAINQLQQFSTFDQSQKQFDQFVFQHFNEENKEKEQEQEQDNKSNDDIIPNDKIFVEWFQTQTKNFNQFKLKLKEKSLENKLKHLIKEFNGNEKRLKDIFEKAMKSQSKSDDQEVINID